MSVTEFEVGGVSYRANPMDARKQFHVARRIGGSVGTGSVESALLALSEQSDEVFDYVIDACLSVVEWKSEGGAWSRVLVPGSLPGQTVIMNEDLRNSLATMLQVVVPVVEANVRGFLSALPSDFLPTLVGRFVKQASS